MVGLIIGVLLTIVLALEFADVVNADWRSFQEFKVKFVNPSQNTSVHPNNELNMLLIYDQKG